MTHFTIHQKTIIPEIVSEPLAKYLLDLIKKDTFNFSVEHVESEQDLKNYFLHVQEALSNSTPINDKLFNKLSRHKLAGYNKTSLPLTLSDRMHPGSFQLINNELFYHPEGMHLDNMRDSYLFGASMDKIYTTSSHQDLIKGFLNLGINLFQTNEGIYDRDNMHTPKKLKPLNFHDLNLPK